MSETLKPTISIITTTYNRRELTERCYHSLLKQSCFDFEWILVDDGSTDGTAERFREVFNEDAPFNRKLIRKENGGKSSALNCAHPYIEGKYLLILDSDDVLKEYAVETAIKTWEKYALDPEIGVVIFQKETFGGQVVAYSKIENRPVDFLKRKLVVNIAADWCEVVRSDVFKKYPLPMFENENYLTGTAMWFRIGADYKCVYINRAIYVCDYLEGGLSKSGKPLRIKNCRGESYCALLRMNRRCPLKLRLRNAVLYNCYGIFSGKTLKELVKEAGDNSLLAAVGYAPGIILYSKWKRKYRIK